MNDTDQSPSLFAVVLIVLLPLRDGKSFKHNHRLSNPFSVQGCGFSPHICSYCRISLMNREYSTALHPESRSETSRSSNTLLSNTQHACDIWKRRACAEISSPEKHQHH
ncbi:hypothetical protein QQF64_035229 [Cirrhinus molitorella]|uniref:Secreted protein n=1 Tax=Cirrhinus molitorella TaxID=172907 RepID=A0ABR3NF68_9TELE